MTQTRRDVLEAGREAYERGAWESANRSLSEADRAEPLAAADLWRLALTAYLIGRHDEFLVALERAHHAFLDDDDPAAAARCAFWLGMNRAERGEMGPAAGWLGRASRLLDQHGQDCVERGYLLLPAGQQQIAAGEPAAAHRTAGDAAALGHRFGDADLVALAVHLQGHAALGDARVEEGLALLDEAMVGVAAGEVTPLVAGLIYCSVIGACRRVYALRRAHEWTAALTDWCERQPGLVSYHGECRVYRSEIMQLRGDWEDALEEARHACALLEQSGNRKPASLARYQEGELHRLRGDHAEADAAYDEARRLGREPQPGLALLRVAQGDVDAAVAMTRRLLGEARDPLARARILPAHIHVALAAGDLDGARAACEELEQTAARYGTSVLDTIVAQARGEVALADDDALTALAALRRAGRGWEELGAPYDGACVRVLLARACRELGDTETAVLELESARETFERLGARPDLDRIEGMAWFEPRSRGGAVDAGRHGHGLTPREREVLMLLATGRTNKAIAADLFISEKTVARHVSNIFAKLGLSSRAAATAFAYEHDLQQPSG